MAAPTLDTGHPGLRVLAEVASILSVELTSPSALEEVVAALRRGLALRRCRFWVRNEAGSAYVALCSPPEPGTDVHAPAVAGWIAAGPAREVGVEGALVRFPLVQDEEPFGLLEAVLPPGTNEHMAHDVLLVVARLLAPVLAAAELSRDLASEVALRTREVEAQRNFAGRIIDSLPVGLYVVDRAYRIRAWNRKRETGTQGVARDDAIGREIFEVLDRQPRDLLKGEFDRVFATGDIQEVEMESHMSGETRYYRITKIPMRLEGEGISHVITVGEDVTEWRQVQQRLSQSDKLAAVGQLAAGVMHEINNPLATILACAEALALRSESLAPSDRASYEEYLHIIDTEVQRCRRIVDSLLDFSRPKTSAKQAVDLNTIVEHTLFLLKHHDRFRRLTVMRELAPDLPRVPADSERLIQSFMALMLNAMDAMDARGILTVRTQRHARRPDEVLIEFVDTGHGIPQDHLPKIFEPFYTTKPQGRGTGLGLSICYGIIQEHRGRIEVESQIGVGSVFKVYLPVE